MLTVMMETEWVSARLGSLEAVMLARSWLVMVEMTRS